MRQQNQQHPHTQTYEDNSNAACSAHQPETTHGRGPKCLAMMWISCLVLTMAGCAFHVYIQVNQFVEMPRTMSLNLLDHFPFPQVTLCWRQRFVSRKWQLHAKSINEVSQRIYEFYRYALDDKESLARLDAQELTLPTLRKSLQQRPLQAVPLESIWHCEYPGLALACSYRNFNVVRHRVYERCLQFVPPSTSIPGSLGVDRRLRLYVSNWPGPPTWASQLGGPPWPQDSLLLSVDPVGHRPRLSESSLALQSHRTVYLEFNEVDTKATPENPCIEYHKQQVRYLVDSTTGATVTFVNSRDDCILLGIQRRLLRICGCVDGLLEVPQEARWAPVCQQVPESMLRYQDLQFNTTLGRWFVRYEDRWTDFRLEADKWNLTARNRCFWDVKLRQSAAIAATCLRPCQTTVYSVRQVAPTSRDAMNRPPIQLRFKEVASRNLSDNSSVFSLYTEDEAVRSSLWLVLDFNPREGPAILQEEFSYPLPNLLADLGGIVGLWFGLSCAGVVVSFRFVAFGMWTRGLDFDEESQHTYISHCSSIMVTTWLLEMKSFANLWVWDSRRMMGLVLTVILVAATSIHLTLQTLAYIRQSITVNQESSPQSAHFPSWILCGATPLNKALLHRQQRNYSVKHSVPFTEYFGRVTFFQKVGLPDSLEQYSAHQLVRRKGLSRWNLTTSPEEEILYCRLDDAPCSASNFHLIKHSKYGICYQFMPPNQTVTALKDPSMHVLFANWDRERSLSSYLSFNVFFLSFLTHPENSHSFEEIGWDVAIKLEPDKLVSNVAHIELVRRKYSKIAQADCVNDLETVRYRVDWTPVETRTFLATQRECEVRFAQQELFRQCQCVDETLDVPEMLANAPFCVEAPDRHLDYEVLSPMDGRLGLVFGEELYDYETELNRSGVRDRQQCQRRVKERHFRTSSTHQCPQLCEETRFSLLLETSLTPDMSYYHSLLRNATQSERGRLGEARGLALSLVLRSDVGVEMKETWTYSALTFWSHVGSIVNLWLDLNVFLLLEAGLFGILLAVGGMRMQQQQSPDSTADVEDPMEEVNGLHCFQVSTTHNVSQALLLLTILGGLCVHIAFPTRIFLNESTSVSLAHNSSEQPPFPTIWFCKTSWMFDFETGHRIIFLRKDRPTGLPSVNVSIDEYFWFRLQSYYNSEAVGLRPEEQARMKLHYIRSHIRQLAFHEEIFNASLSQERDIFHCRYRGRPCSHRDFIPFYHPTHILCHQFVPPVITKTDSHYFHEVVTDNFLEVGFTERGENEFFRALDDIGGFHVKLSPFPWSVSLGESMRVSLGVNSIIRAGYRRITSISTAKKPCSETKPNATYFVDWTHNKTQTMSPQTPEDCATEIFQRHLFNRCGCVDILWHVPVRFRDAPTCHEVPPFLVNYDKIFYERDQLKMQYGQRFYDFSEEVLRLASVHRARYRCHSDVLQTLWNMSLNCPRLCRREEYRFLHSTELPLTIKQMLTRRNNKLKNSSRNIEDSLSMFEDRFSMYFVTVKLENLDANLEEQVAYSWQRFVADVGEIVDLWLGISVAIVVLTLSKVAIRAYLVWKAPRIVSAEGLEPAEEITAM